MIVAVAAAFGLGVAGGVTWATHTAEQIAKAVVKHLRKM